MEIQKTVRYTKFADLTVKEIKEKENGDTTITGYASTFGNEDLYSDIMQKGCFKKTIKDTGGQWPVLYQHREAVGINEKAKEDKDGLYVESTIFSSKIERAKELKALIDAYSNKGFSMGLSVGGLIKSYELRHSKEKGWQTVIIEFQVLEHSITPVPANQKARIETNKSFGDFIKNNAVQIENKKNIEEFLKRYKDLWL